MPLWCGKCADCVWSYTYGGITDSELQNYLDNCLAPIGNNAEGNVILSIAYRVPLLSRGQMDTLVAFAEKTLFFVARTRAHAFVSESVSLRHLSQEMHKRVTDSLGFNYTKRTFQDCGNALTWLSVFSPKLEPKEVLMDIRSKVDPNCLCPAILYYLGF